MVVIFVRRVGLREIVTPLRNVGPRVLWLLVPYAIGTTIGAFPWAWLLSPRVRPRALGVVLGRFAASSANSLLPFFGLAGEPSRLLWLPRSARAEGLAAIVVDRALYNAGSALLLLGGAIVAFLATPLPRLLVGAAAVTAIVMLTVTVALCWMALRLGVGRGTATLLRRFLGEQYAGAEFGRAVDGALLTLIRGPRARLWLGVSCHFLSRAAIALEVYLGLRLLHVSVGLAPAFVLSVVPIALSVFFSSIPSLLGVQEGAQTLVASALLLNPALVLTVVLLQRGRQLFFSLLMPVFLGSARPSPAQREGAGG